MVSSLQCHIVPTNRCLQYVVYFTSLLFEVWGLWHFLLWYSMNCSNQCNIGACSSAAYVKIRYVQNLCALASKGYPWGAHLVHHAANIQ